MNAMIMQYGLTTISLWDGIKDGFDAVLSFFSSLWTFIDQAIEGIGLTIDWLMTAIPINFLVVNHMPGIIVAAATLTIGIFVLRTIFGFWIGGS